MESSNKKNSQGNTSKKDAKDFRKTLDEKTKAGKNKKDILK